MKHTLILLLFSCTLWGQINCDTIKYPKLLGNSYQCKWIIFKLDKPIEGIIIEHYPAMAGCGTSAFASLSIIKIDNDTIRVIGLCNENLYPIGQKIKIYPAEEPTFQVHIPSSFIDGNRVEKKKAKRKSQVNPNVVVTTGSFDNTILKTTWGRLSLIL